MKNKDGFSVITPTIRGKFQYRLINNFIAQKFQEKELIIVINKDDMDGEILYEYEKRYENIRVFRQPEEITLGECLNFAIKQSKYNMIAKFDDDDYYSPFYLDEMYEALKNNKGDIVGKDKRYYYLEGYKELVLRKFGNENKSTEWIAGATLCFRKEVFEIVQFKKIGFEEDTNFLKDSLANGLRIFSTSRYNYIVFRKNNVEEHTWKIGIDYFIDMCDTVKKNMDFENAFEIVSKNIIEDTNLKTNKEKLYDKVTTDEKHNNHNKEYRENVLKLIEKIPESNGSRYYEKINKNVAIVTDEFMFNYYDNAVNLFYVNYDNYKEVFENNRIDLFLFITCWKGMKDSDWRGITNSPLRRRQFFEIIDFCKSKSIKIIFQSIEDPSDYKTYVDIAKKCDYIFTTDANKISNYKEDCNHDNVYPLEFGINPYIHNPIGIRVYERKDDVLFAGAWMDRFEERCNDMVAIFEGVLKAGASLNIIDRNFYLDVDDYYFPKEYIPYISPNIDYKYLQKIHKLYNWCINLNSIKYSPTMCSRRTYEAQALGNLILSNYSLAVIKNNPNLFIITNNSQVKNIFEKYNKEKIYEEQIKSVRNVMNSKTVFERLEYMFRIIDMKEDLNLDKSILVIVKKITPNIEIMFEKQSYLNKYLLEEEKVKDVYKYYDFVTFFKDEYIYGEHYLQDMINGFKYTDSDYITKDSYCFENQIVSGIEHNYVNEMKDKYKTVFDCKVFKLDKLKDLNQSVKLENGYSIDYLQLNINTQLQDRKKDKYTKMNVSLYEIIRNKFVSKYRKNS